MFIKVTSELIPLIHDVAEKSWKDTYAHILSQEQLDYMLGWMYSVETLQNHIEKPNYHYYLIQKDDLFLGFMGFENHYEKETTKLHRIYFLKEAQKPWNS